MSQLTAPMNAALAGPRPLLFGSVEIGLPGYTVRLLDGAGEVMIAGHKFVGRDDTYGTIESVSRLSDGGGDSAPALTLTMLTSSGAALATLASSSMQGSAVFVRMGAIDRATGTVVPDPYVLFTGELDVPTIKWGANSRKLEYKVTSVFERFFQVEEGKRLVPAFHRSIWPSESGMDGVNSVDQPEPWGQSIPNPWIQTRTNDPSIGASTTLKT